MSGAWVQDITLSATSVICFLSPGKMLTSFSLFKPTASQKDAPVAMAMTPLWYIFNTGGGQIINAVGSMIKNRWA